MTSTFSRDLTWNGTVGQFDDPTKWSLPFAPRLDDTAYIDSGTVFADSLPDSIMIKIRSIDATAGTLVLSNTDLTFFRRIVLDAFGAGTPVLLLRGASTNDGPLTTIGGAIQIAAASGPGPGTLINTSDLDLNGSSAKIEAAPGSARPTLVNNGYVDIVGYLNYGPSLIDATVTGRGRVTIERDAKIEFGAGVGADQRVSFESGSTEAVLQLDAPATFLARLDGFVAGDTISVKGTSITSASYTATSSATGMSTGVLTLLNGSTVVANLNFNGVYSLSNFNISGSGAATTITTAVQNAANGSRANSVAAGPVYRFFDTTTGTHFFTANSGENIAVAAGRGDLVKEANGFGSVASTDLNVAPVFRFFDTRFGTHFFTSSIGERDTILDTRTDLTYEPQATFYEHSIQQTGDTAVYRFFDKTNGTHFYTGDSAEYAALATPGTATYRADLVSEGVSFYAPKGVFL